MRQIEDIAKTVNLSVVIKNENRILGHFKTRGGALLSVIGTIEVDGSEHVSVSLNDRTPTWEEMCEVKDLFFDPEELVVQLHPQKSRAINLHTYCLHMWRKIKIDW